MRYKIHVQSKHVTDAHSAFVATICSRTVRRERTVRFKSQFLYTSDRFRERVGVCKQCMAWHEKE